MREKLNAYFNSKLFIILISLISLLCWYFYQEVLGIGILVVIAIIMLLSNQKIIALLPILFNSLFICRSYISLNKVPIVYFIFFGILIAVFIYYLIKQKINLKGSKMLFGFIALAVCSLLSLINLNDNGQAMRYIYSLGNVLFLFLYLLFSSTIKKDKNNFYFISHVMLWLGIVLSLQLLITGFELGSFDNKITNLGWGGANSAAIYINISIICLFYLLTRTKKYYSCLFYFLVILFFTMIIVLTQSRTGYLALAATIIPCIVVSYIYSKNKKTTAIIYSVCTLIALISCIILKDELIKILNLTFRVGINDNGRFDIWGLAIRDGLKHFMIGNGMFSVGSNIATPDPRRLVVMHNTFVQCFYAFGFLGLLALAYHYFEKYRVILKSQGYIKWFILMITLSGFVHGMLDNTYFMISYMIILIPFLCIIEKEQVDKNEEVEINMQN